MKSQPDRYKENEVWYDAGQDKGNVGSHVDNEFDDNGKHNNKFTCEIINLVVFAKSLILHQNFLYSSFKFY